MIETVLALDDVSLDVGTGAPDAARRWRVAADGVSLSVAAGECLVLLGEGESGKSDLARLAVGLARPHGGAVRIDGRPVRLGSGQAGMVFRGPGAGSATPRARRTVGQPSPGERQLMAVEAALARSPRLLVADEPTAELDAPDQAGVLNLLRASVAQRRLALLLTTDDPAVARHMADTVAVMYLGRAVETGPAQRVLGTPLHPYTRLLLETAPDPSRTALDPAVRGPLPDAADPPSGCGFHPRCPFAFLRCRFERPADTIVGTPPDALPDHGTVACHGVAEGRLVADPAAPA